MAQPGDWSTWRAQVDPAGYDERFRRLAATGQNPHGEADLVESFGPATVLDAGCGTGRVAIELAHRGIEVVGTDLDDDMLAQARANAPELTWIAGDLADLDLVDAAGTRRTFDVVVLAGNVIPYVDASRRPAAVAACARHVRATGRLVAGFSLRDGWPTLGAYDDWCNAAGLTLEHRWSTWDREPYADGPYAVSVHHPTP